MTEGDDRYKQFHERITNKKKLDMDEIDENRSEVIKKKKTC